MLPLTGCPCLWDPQQCIRTDTAEDMLDKALGELHQQPKMWGTTLTNLVKQMEASGSNLANEVQGIYNSMLGQTTGEYSCRADFVGDRVSQRLQALGHSINPQRWAMPQLTPVICSTQPAGPLVPGSDKFIKFYGYDLKMLGKDDSFNAALRYSDNGEVVLSSAGFISTPHDYMLMLDLQSPAVQQAMKGMDGSRGPQLVLAWENQVVETDQSEESALAIQVPDVPLPPKEHRSLVLSGRMEATGVTGTLGPCARCLRVACARWSTRCRRTRPAGCARCSSRRSGAEPRTLAPTPGPCTTGRTLASCTSTRRPTTRHQNQYQCTGRASWRISNNARVAGERLSV
jgi:hypothetical protein